MPAICMEGNKMREKLADRLVPALLAIGAVLTAIDVVWTFTVAPLVQGARLSEPAIIAGQVVTTKLLLSQKIFYLHVPVAVASFAAMAVAAFFAARFLATKDRAHDRASRTAMQVTLVFIIATMISGDVWTRFEWGVWWVWEPRLTTYFILMLLVIGYFILRNALDDPERSARFGAVFCIIAFIDAPISFFITRLVPSSVHPVVFRTDSGLPPAMLIPFLLGLFGMCMIAFALYRYALRVNTAAQLASLVGTMVMPCFLSNPFRAAITTGAQSVRGINPIRTVSCSGLSDPAAHAGDVPFTPSKED